jgi:hypothetical protein
MQSKLKDGHHSIRKYSTFPFETEPQGRVL